MVHLNKLVIYSDLISLHDMDKYGSVNTVVFVIGMHYVAKCSFNVFMAWTDTPLSTVVFVKGMYNFSKCLGGFIKLVYLF